MKIETPLLFQLARIAGLSSPEEGDANITIPNSFINVLNLSFPLDETNLPPSGDLQRSTTHTWAGLTITGGGGAVSSPLANLVAGFWRFDVQASISSNYTQGGAITFNTWIELVYGNGQVFLMGLLAGGAAAAPIAYGLTRTVEILVPVQSTLRVQALNNAAGNSLVAAFDVLATRLF